MLLLLVLLVLLLTLFHPHELIDANARASRLQPVKPEIGRDVANPLSLSHIHVTHLLSFLSPPSLRLDRMSQSQPSSSSSTTTTSTQYERFVAEDVAYHKAATPLSEMPSCTDMFDKWASCFALGPQLKAVYRYGGMQDCRAKLDDFKYCLTMKGMSPDEKYEAWIRRKAEKTAERRMGRESAENVWELRRDPNEAVRSKAQASGTIV